MPDTNESYPVTKKLQVELEQDNLMGTLGQYALDYIGEYEHGSVDLFTLYPETVTETWKAMSEESDGAFERLLLQFAANVLHDYLLSVSVQEGETNG